MATTPLVVRMYSLPQTMVGDVVSREKGNLKAERRARWIQEEVMVQLAVREDLMTYVGHDLRARAKGTE